MWLYLEAELLKRFSSVQLLSRVLTLTLMWTAACQASLSITIPQSMLKLLSIESVVPSNRLSLHHSHFPPAFKSFPAAVSFLMSQFFTSDGRSVGASASHQSFQGIIRTDFLYNWWVWSPCSPRDSQESSPTLQFKSIGSSVLSFLYSPTLTSICNYWKNRSFD